MGPKINGTKFEILLTGTSKQIVLDVEEEKG
jgi:hypothetical protein